MAKRSPASGKIVSSLLDESPAAGGNSADVKIPVACVWTGGTIGSVVERDACGREISKPGLVPVEFEAKLPEELRSIYAFDWHYPFALRANGRPVGVDSTEMTIQLQTKIIQKIQAILTAQRNTEQGIVVSHGTDTLASTAAYAAFALQNLDRPVVFTGAQIRPGHPHTDAFRNFSLAADIATRTRKMSKSSIRDRLGEVLVAFGEQVIRGVAAQKDDGVGIGTFNSPHQGALAHVIGSNVLSEITDHSSLSSARVVDEGIYYYPGLSGSSFVMKWTPSLTSNPDVLRRVLDPHRYDAVVIEGYATGNIPTTVKEIIDRKAREMLLIITPGSATHGMHETLYEGSPELSHPNALFARGMLSSVAETKFQWLHERGRLLGLEESNLREWVRNRFPVIYANESLHQIKNFSNVEDRHKLLVSKHIVDLNADVVSALATLLFKERKEFLQRKAGEMNIHPDRTDDWVTQRVGLEIPLQTVQGTWDVAANDPLAIYYYIPDIIEHQLMPSRDKRHEYHIPHEIPARYAHIFEREGIPLPEFNSQHL